MIGSALTATSICPSFSQPFPSVPVTVYVVFVLGVTVIAAVISLVFHT